MIHMAWNEIKSKAMHPCMFPLQGKEASPGDSERLRLLEQSLAQLWEHVEDSGHRAEQLHSEVLGLYQGLQQQKQLVVVQGQAEPGRAGLEPWLDGLLEDKLAEMKLRLDEDRLHREQVSEWGTSCDDSDAHVLVVSMQRTVHQAEMGGPVIREFTLYTNIIPKLLCRKVMQRMSHLFASIKL